MTWMRRLDSLTTMGGGRSEPSGPDGSFRIDDVEPGEGFVEISALHGSWDGESGLFEVLPGSEASAIVVRAEPVDEERITRASSSTRTAHRWQARRSRRGAASPRASP